MNDKKILKEEELKNVTGGIGSGGGGGGAGAGGGSGVVIAPEPIPDIGPTSPKLICKRPEPDDIVGMKKSLK